MNYSDIRKMVNEVGGFDNMRMNQAKRSVLVKEATDKCWYEIRNYLGRCIENIIEEDPEIVRIIERNLDNEKK